MLAAPEEQPILLHPGLSEVYRNKVANLTEALNVSETKAEAAELMRSLLSETRLTPESGELCIDLVGELAGLLGLCTNKNTHSVSAAGVL